MSKLRTIYNHLKVQQLIAEDTKPEITLNELLAMNTKERKLYKYRCRKLGIKLPTK